MTSIYRGPPPNEKIEKQIHTKLLINLTQASAGRDMPATKELRGQDPNVPNLGREALSMTTF